MAYSLEATDHSDQGKRGLHGHTVVPGAFGTQLTVLRDAVLTAKTIIGQHNAASTELLDKRMELLVRDIHGVPIPIDHLAKAVENPTQLDPNAPTPFIFGLFANLLGAVSFSNGKQQLDRVAINNQEKAGGGEKPLVPVLVGDQQPLQPGAIGQASKQDIIVSFEPTVKGAKVTSFQSEQQADGNHLTWVEFGLAMLGHLFHLIVDKAEHMDDN